MPVHHLEPDRTLKSATICTSIPKHLVPITISHTKLWGAILALLSFFMEEGLK